MIFGFAGLFVELRLGSVIAIVAGLLSKLRVHRGVFVGFAFDGELKAAREQGLFVVVTERTGVAEHKLGMEQAEVSKRVLCFLSGGVAEEFGEIGAAELLGHIGKEQVLAIGHAFAAKGGFDVGLGGRLGKIHGFTGRSFDTSAISYSL